MPVLQRQRRRWISRAREKGEERWGRKEGRLGWRCASAECGAVCQNDTLRRAALQSGYQAAWPFTLSIPFHKASRPPFDDEDNDYDGRLGDDPAPFCSASLAFPARSLLAAYLPSAYLSLILPLPYLQPTPPRAAYPTAHFLASPSWPPYSPHFSLLISHPSTRQPLSRPSSSPPPSPPCVSLSLLHPSFLSLFPSRSLASSRVLSPAVHPLTLALTGIVPSRSLTLAPSFSSGSPPSNPRIDFTLPTA